MPRSTARLRLARVLEVLGWSSRSAVPLPSDSNDAWRIDDVVLRICYRGDRDRFERSRLVLEELPAAISAPSVLDHGEVDGMAWQLTRWLTGTPLALAWPELAQPDRRRAVTQVGAMLADLNGHEFSIELRRALSAPRPLNAQTSDAVIGADLNPLPVARARLLLEPASRLPMVDEGLVARVGELFDELEPADPLGSPALAELGGGVVVHGDAHPMNVLWNDGLVTLLDWEWVRLGAPELEIEPYLHRGSGHNAPVVAESAQIVRWLASAHPAAVSHPDLVMRVWLIELAHALRQLLLWPPTDSAGQLPEDHPLRRLRTISRGPDHLRELLPRGG